MKRKNDNFGVFNISLVFYAPGFGKALAKSSGCRWWVSHPSMIDEQSKWLKENFTTSEFYVSFPHGLTLGCAIIF
jgi:hypothetical protein